LQRWQGAVLKGWPTQKSFRCLDNTLLAEIAAIEIAPNGYGDVEYKYGL